MRSGAGKNGTNTARDWEESRITLPMISTDNFHIPVLGDEVLDGLEIEPGKTFVDATLGGGGHTQRILESGGRVIGIDQDEEAINHVKEKLEESGKFRLGRDLVVIHGNFADIEAHVESSGWKDIHGVLFDLGMSSHQVDTGSRGFSFEKDAPLDMRMNPDQQVSADNIVNSYSFEKLYEIFSKYAEEINSRAIASAVVRARTLSGGIHTTGQLVTVIDKVIRATYPGIQERQAQLVRRSACARIFQALRIVVNNEIESLKQGLEGAWKVLEPGGRVVCLSYHSLEDRTVKLWLRDKVAARTGRMITRRPVEASENEIHRNTRARSAKLRIGEKL